MAAAAPDDVNANDFESPLDFVIRVAKSIFEVSICWAIVCNQVEVTSNVEVVESTANPELASNLTQMCLLVALVFAVGYVVLLARVEISSKVEGAVVVSVKAYLIPTFNFVAVEINEVIFVEFHNKCLSSAPPTLIPFVPFMSVINV